MEQEAVIDPPVESLPTSHVLLNQHERQTSHIRQKVELRQEPAGRKAAWMVGPKAQLWLSKKKRGQDLAAAEEERYSQTVHGKRPQQKGAQMSLWAQRGQNGGDHAGDCGRLAETKTGQGPPANSPISK